MTLQELKKDKELINSVLFFIKYHREDLVYNLLSNNDINVEQLIKHLKLETELIKYLKWLGFSEIEKTDDMTGISVSFFNPDYNFNSQLINQFGGKISNFIDNLGFDSDDFIIQGSVIMFPKNFYDL
jgi:hypothetical protein